MTIFHASRGRTRYPGLIDKRAENHLPITDNLVFRLSGDSGLFTNGDKSNEVQNTGDLVYVWADISGNSRDYTQSAESARPVYVKNKVGTHGAVQFVSSDYLYRAEAVVGITNATVFAVVYLSSMSQKGAVFGVGDNDNNGWSMGVGSNYFENAGNNFLIVHAGVGWANGGGIGVGAHLLTANYINKNPYMYVDGQYGISPTINDPNAVNQASYIGWQHNNVNRYYNDYILEIIGYSTNLSANSRERVERYLKTKFNIL